MRNRGGRKGNKEVNRSLSKTEKQEGIELCSKTC